MLFSVHWGYFLPMMDGQKWPVYAIFHTLFSVAPQGQIKVVLTLYRLFSVHAMILAM